MAATGDPRTADDIAGSPSGLELRLKQAPRAFQRAARHPVWFRETVRGLARRRRGRNGDFSLLAYSEYLLAEREAVAAVTGRREADCQISLNEVWSPLDDDHGRRPTFGGSPTLVRIAGAVVRLNVPEVVVETGVAQGVTTASILDALETNGEGHLFSIDLPVLHEDPGSYVGRLVPERLRSRWSLKLGPSRRLLPHLMDRLGQFDLFLHDSEHSYESQLEEYRAVWPHLRPGGVLISDDVANAAFVEFAACVRHSPCLVAEPHDSGAVGLLRKGS